jgi:hypothetical protein
VKQKLLLLRHHLGPVGLGALIVLAAVAAFHSLVLQPLQARSQALEVRAAREAPRAPDPAAASAGDKLAALYSFLRKKEKTSDWLARLHGIAAQTGVRLSSASYRTQKTDGRIERYEIVVPVAGDYAQIRDFATRALAEIPVLSIDQLTLKRDGRQSGELHAQLRMTLHTVN